MRTLLIALLLGWMWSAAPDHTLAQEDETPTAEEVAAEVTGDANGNAKPVEVANIVEIEPKNPDDRIERRLQEILETTGWFKNPKVDVDRGVVFLRGTADSQKHQAWAESTAMHTSDVVAVVNRLKVAEPPLWNFAPAFASLRQLTRESTSLLPFLLVAVLIGFMSFYLGRGGAATTRWLIRDRVESSLLRQVAGNSVGVLVFVIGLYVALRVSGLTRLAVTLLGGTGLIGLALGFAFKDIAENYLASILLSLHHPFRVGDLIEVDGSLGFVRKVTTRGTILNTLEGNQIQLPNSTVYKGKITNYTATPLSRREFSVGIGFDTSAVAAQGIIMDVLTQQDFVVTDPAPIVVVESLGSATVNLRSYFWFDQTTHSPLKVSSSVIRQVKQKFIEAGITMPDEARELVFPEGVPVRMSDAVAAPAPSSPPATTPQPPPAEPKTTSGEGDLSTEKDEVMRATKDDETVKAEQNLIE